MTATTHTAWVTSIKAHGDFNPWGVQQLAVTAEDSDGVTRHEILTTDLTWMVGDLLQVEIKRITSEAAS